MYKTNLKTLLRRAQLGEITPLGDKTIALVMAELESSPAGARLTHEERFEQARALVEPLEAGQDVDLEDDAPPDGFVDLSLFAGATDLERAQNMLEVTEPGFAQLPDAEKKKRAQAHLDEREAALAEEVGVEDEIDDGSGLPLRSSVAQAQVNLDRRDPTFRLANSEERCFGDRVRREAARIAQLRNADVEDEATRQQKSAQRLKEHRAAHPNALTLSDLRELYPCVVSPHGVPVQGDVSRAIAWCREKSPALKDAPWDQQVRVGMKALEQIKQAGEA